MAADFPTGPDYGNPLLGLLSGASGFSQGLMSGMSSAAQALMQRQYMASEMARNQAMAGYYQARPDLMADTNDIRRQYELGPDGLLHIRQQTADAATQRATTGQQRVDQQGDAQYGYTAPDGTFVPGSMADRAAQTGFNALNTLGRNAPFFAANPQMVQQYGSTLGAFLGQRVPDVTTINLSASDTARNRLANARADYLSGPQTELTTNRADLTGQQADAYPALVGSQIARNKGTANLDDTTARWLGPKSAAQIATDRARANLDNTNASLAPGLAASLIQDRAATGGAATMNANTNAFNARNRPGVVTGAAPGKGLLPNGLSVTEDRALAQELAAHQQRAVTVGNLLSQAQRDSNLTATDRVNLRAEAAQLQARISQINAVRARVVQPVPAANPTGGAGYSVVPLSGAGNVRVPNAPPLPPMGGGGVPPGNVRLPNGGYAPAANVFGPTAPRGAVTRPLSGGAFTRPLSRAELSGLSLPQLHAYKQWYGQYVRSQQGR